MTGSDAANIMITIKGWHWWNGRLIYCNKQGLMGKVEEMLELFIQYYYLSVNFFGSGIKRVGKASFLSLFFAPGTLSG